MSDIKELLDKKVEERVNRKDRFDILFISDADSRMYNMRGITAMEDFCRFYGGIADVSLVTMDSRRVCQIRPDLSKFTVVWVDNVVNRELARFIDEERNRITENVLPGWHEDVVDMEKEIDGAGSDEDADKVRKEYDEYLFDVGEYRALSSTRFIYALDEFIWEGPGGRQNTVQYVKTAEDLIIACDELVVPNTQLAQAITDFRFVGNKPIAVVPTFMSERFYPVHRIFKRSNSGVSSIRKPKILIKGLVIPKAIQDYIFYNHDKADITVSTGGVLEDRVYELLLKKEIRNLVHWSNPLVTDRNIVTTQAIERDCSFDFVVLTMPDDPTDSVYTVADVDTDALSAVACGAVVFAQIDDIHYGDGIHICKETGLTFGHDITVEQFKSMITKWSSCVSWDNAHEKQRKLLETRMVGSNYVMGGFYGAMAGKLVSEKRNDAISKLVGDGRGKN